MRIVTPLVILGVLVGGCQRETPAPTDTTPAPAEFDPKPVAQEAEPGPLPGPTHVLLMGHEATAKTARFVSLNLRGTASLDRYSQPALTHENRPGHYYGLAAVGQGRAFHPIHDKDGWRLAVRDLQAGKNLSEIKLEVDAVTALMAVGNDLFIGAGMSVGRLSLGDSSFQVLADRKSGFAGKAYDLFARDGRTVVAIDDLVTPIWADLLWPEGGAWKREPWTLPSFINGTYRLAAVHLDDKNDKNGTLYAIGSYGIQSGNGQDLTRLAIVGGKLQVKEGAILNGGMGDDLPVLEEHIDRGTDKVEKIIAGKNVTPWTGLALVKGKSGAVNEVAIAAGTRGLLVVPADFGRTSKARVVQLGHVYDVANIGDQIIALTKGIEDGASTVLWLDPTLSTSKSVELAGIYTQIVRDR